MLSKLTLLMLLAKLRWGGLNTRYATVHKLGDLRDTRTIPHLSRALVSEDSSIRAAAITAFGKLGAEGMPYLVSVLRDRRTHWSSERKSAVDELSRIGGSEALAGVALGLRDPERYVREHACESLVSADSEIAKKHLRAALTDPDAQTRLVVINGLRGAEFAADVAAGLRDNDVEVRLAAVQAVCGFGRSDQDRALEVTLRDPEPAVRRSGIAALKLSDKAHAAHLLRSAMADDESQVRLDVLNLVDRLEPTAALELASIGLRDGDAKVRSLAISVLGSLEGQDARNALAEAMEGYQGEDRLLTAEALGEAGDARAMPVLAVSLFETGGRRQRRILELLAAQGWQPENEADRKVVEAIRRRAEATERAHAALRNYDFDVAAQEGAAALPALAAAAKRLGDSRIQQALDAIQGVLLRHNREATEDELNEIIALPPRLEWTVKVIQFAGDIQAMMAIGGAHREIERRFDVDCSEIKNLAASELSRRPPTPDTPLAPPDAGGTEPMDPARTSAKKSARPPKDGDSPTEDAPVGSDGMFRFKCPRCQMKLKASPLHVGKKAKCQKCGEPIVVPPPDRP